MRSKSILYGVNVPISPTSTADAKLTNNITISNVAYPGINESKSDNPYIHTSTVNQENLKGYELQRSEVQNTTSEIKTREIKQDNISERNPETLDSYLLKLYQTILLSDNKKLIANVVLKNSIVLTGEDLEKIIKLKTGKECIINYEDPDTGCFKINSVVMKVASIRIVEENESVSDFKIKYNRDYLELVTNYQLNLKYVLVN